MFNKHMSGRNGLVSIFVIFCCYATNQQHESAHKVLATHLHGCNKCESVPSSRMPLGKNTMRMTIKSNQDLTLPLRSLILLKP
ncbi:hypothetical protein B0F90DRAFT_1802624 [Multifurca ochricompacta]|uniref:Secreted protein n=1 Tax=Multifurca ochricompacta TaxID=376703 RepID=A0AAD4QGA3_9AGAM|nr:hypothetical protein B0F90DRAFT_1802624 [Multifurca ochricompacta]